MRPGKLASWPVVNLFAGAGAMGAVRVATPATVDEPWLAGLLFFLLPGLLVGLLARWRQAAGLAAAVAWPLLWALLGRDSQDGWPVWVPVVAAAALILATARASAREAARHAARPAGDGGPRLPALLTAVSLVATAAAFLWPGPGRPADGTRLLLLGVDGATWQLVDRFADAGRLPNLQRLRAAGREAPLRSLPSTLSPQVWTTMGTGYPPERHGMWDFAATPDQLKTGFLWHALLAEQRSIGLCGWYFTWPPPPGLGPRDFVIPSALAPAGDTHPPDYSFFWQIWTQERPGEGGRAGLVKAGWEAFRHGVRMSTLRQAAGEVLVRKLRPRSEFDEDWRKRMLSAALQADISVELLRTRRPEFAALLFTQIDRLCHKYWKFMEPEGFADVTPEDRRRYGRVIEEGYAEVDRVIGRLLAAVSPDADVLVVSDHGFQASHSGAAGSWCSIRTENLLQAMGESERVFGTSIADEVVLRPLATGAAGDSLLVSLQQSLEAARVTGDPSPLFKADRHGETLMLALAPRDAIPERASITLAGREYPFEELVYAGQGAQWSGEHLPDGIFVLSGPAAARAASADSLNVLDVAPTVAALLDLPQCPGWTGRAAVPRPAGAAVRLAEFPLPAGAVPATPGVDPGLKEKLRAIGYVR